MGEIPSRVRIGHSLTPVSERSRLVSLSSNRCFFFWVVQFLIGSFLDGGICFYHIADCKLGFRFLICGGCLKFVFAHEVEFQLFFSIWIFLDYQEIILGGFLDSV